MAKICMLVTSELQGDPRVQREAQFTHDAGHDVTVVCREYQGAALPYTVLPLNIPRQKQKLGKYLERLRFNLQLILTVLRLRPSLVHANDFDTLPAGYIGSRLVGAKLVYDSHELWNEVGFVAGSQARLLLNVERFFARRADAVTTVSAALARKLATNFGIPQPATILNVPYYIPPEKLPPRAWHKRFENVKVALYQGKFTARRRLDQVIRAGHFLDDGIVIVLRGLGPYLDTMRQLVAAEKLEDRVFILDPVPMNEMIAEASGADIGILAEDPQFQGEVASPNKLFEYIMAGMPVISANITAVHDVMDGLGICEYYRPEDGEDLARVINALCKDEARLNEMKANCRKNAFQLSWDNEGRKLVDIYEALLKS